MSSAVFHIELRVQNVDTPEHVEAIGKSMQRAATLIAGNAILILGDSCSPQIEAYGEDFKNGRWEIDLQSPDEASDGS